MFLVIHKNMRLCLSIPWLSVRWLTNNNNKKIINTHYVRQKEPTQWISYFWINFNWQCWKKLMSLHIIFFQLCSIHMSERLFLGTFQDQLKWLTFLLAKFYGLGIGFLVCYWYLWVLDFPCGNLLLSIY